MLKLNCPFLYGPNKKIKVCLARRINILTRLVGVSEPRAEVVHQVQVTPLLHAAPGLSESLLGNLVELFSAQAQVVAHIGAQHLLEDVEVIRRVPLSLRAVDETLDLTGGGGRNNVGYGCKSNLPTWEYIYISRTLKTNNNQLTFLLISG